MTDPRTTATAAERSALPVVARPTGGVPTWALIAVVVLVGVLLFSVLNARRQALSAPAVTIPAADRQIEEALPTLYVPPAPVAPPVAVPVRLEPQEPVLPPEPRIVVQQAPPVVVAPAAVPAAAPEVERPARAAGGAALVFDASQPRGEAAATTSPAQSPALGEGNATAGRVRAGSIANRATTIPQGTMIAAVLETAFDSSRAGFARALVQRDVRGFDGSRILVPRGSRLIGEYGADVSAGQKRALIIWTRLIRPDGATIAIGSPATDTVGTNGIRARVNTHFLERFSGAILQSALDVGVNLASRSVDSPVIVALPGTVQNTTTGIVNQQQIPPTLKIRQGKSVSVFVARDLDFTEVEQEQ